MNKDRSASLTFIAIEKPKTLMQYHKFTVEKTIIEFHNSWLGEETVIVNGKLVSKKSSIMGITHPFEVHEKGIDYMYELTSEMLNDGSVILHLRRNGKLIEGNVPLKYGSRPKPPGLKAKKEGIAKLNAYAVEEAIPFFEEAIKKDENDAEAYFHLACAYSILEKPDEGFGALKKSLKLNLPNREAILSHDMLAFLRMHQDFEAFWEKHSEKKPEKKEKKGH
jgi:tetratricopeptide (TPR) repeat protein